VALGQHCGVASSKRELATARAMAAALARAAVPAIANQKLIKKKQQSTVSEQRWC